MRRILLAFLILAALLSSACAAPIAAPIKFEQIGKQGTTVYLMLTSSSSIQVTDEELANRLKIDWQNNLADGNRIQVMVFDNKEAAQRYMELQPKQWTLPLADLDKELDQILPHHIATYSRIKASGENRCIFYSRDAEGTVKKEIKY